MSCSVRRSRLLSLLTRTGEESMLDCRRCRIVDGRNRDAFQWKRSCVSLNGEITTLSGRSGTPQVTTPLGLWIPQRRFPSNPKLTASWHPLVHMSTCKAAGQRTTTSMPGGSLRNWTRRPSARRESTPFPIRRPSSWSSIPSGSRGSTSTRPAGRSGRMPSSCSVR